MRRLFSCVTPSTRSDSESAHAQVQLEVLDVHALPSDIVLFPGTKKSGITWAGVVQAKRPQGPGTTRTTCTAGSLSSGGAARSTGLAKYSETDVLHYVEGECCDLLFVRAKLQEPSIAAMLEQQELLRPEHSNNQGGSEAFLMKLLGAERAQAAAEAVQRGVPYRTVLERELPADKQLGGVRSSPNPLVPAQLACQSGPFPWLSEANQLPYWTPFSTQVQEGEFTEQPQEQSSSRTKGLRLQSPLPPLNEARNSHSASKPVSAADFGGSSSSSFFDSQLSSSLLVSGNIFREGTASVSSSTFWSSSAPPSSLHTQGSSLSLQHQTSSCIRRNGPFLMPTLGSPNCSKASLQQGLTELPCPAPAKAKPDADLSHSLISKAQGLSNAALDRIMSPSLHQQNSGDYDRTLAMLQILQLDHSPATSNQQLPSFPRKSLSTPSIGTTYPPQDNEDRAATCGSHLGRQHGASSSACTSQDAGLYVGTLAPAPGNPAISPSAAADKVAPAAVRSPQIKDLVSEDRGPRMGCPRASSSLHAERPLTNELEDIAEEKSCSSNVKATSEEKRQPRELLESHAQAAFEVSVLPVQTETRRSKPLAMVNFADISDQMQVQGFLLSLAESQLLLLSSLLPKHAIDFLARQSSATDAIPQNMAKLARGHEAVTLLFMDICGFTTMAKSVEPQEIMALLNTLFSTLDRLTDQYNVTKVETAGDCYIVSAGVLSSNSCDGFSHTLDRHSAPEASARRVMEFAKAVLQEAAKIMMPRSTSPVQVRVGMHTGNVVSGLIGSKLPKFSIFGDTMNTAARMESTGVPGRIHVSETTQGLLPEYAWESVGLIPVKGKGNMHTYLWDSNKSWSGLPCISADKTQTSHIFGAMLPLPPEIDCLKGK